MQYKYQNTFCRKTLQYCIEFKCWQFFFVLKKNVSLHLQFIIIHIFSRMEKQQQEGVRNIFSKIKVCVFREIFFFFHSKPNRANFKRLIQMSYSDKYYYFFFCYFSETIDKTHKNHCNNFLQLAYIFYIMTPHVKQLDANRIIFYYFCFFFFLLRYRQVHDRRRSISFFPDQTFILPTTRRDRLP